METEVRTWWVMRGADKYGPYTRTELKQMAISGNVVADDHIWKDGLKKPVLASSISGLIPPEKLAPPPPEPEAAASAPPVARALASTPEARALQMYSAPVTSELDTGHARAFDGEAIATVVGAGSGGNWVSGGWRLLAQAPLQWLIVIAISGGIGYCARIALETSPAFGFLVQLLNMFLGPVLMAGTMVMCHAVEQGESASPALIFSGFAHRFGSLLGVGFCVTVFMIVVFILAAVLFALLIGGTGLLHTHNPGDIKELMTSIQHGGALKLVLVGLLIVFVSLYLIVGAYWFAPGLVFFYQQNPFEAVLNSLGAAVRNWAAMFVYGLVFILVCIGMGLLIVPLKMAGLPQTLFPLLAPLIITPLTMGAVYCSFQDVFGIPD